jgi:hypothetical protein
MRAQRRRWAAVEHLLQVDNLGCITDFPLGILGERRANEVGIEERLVDLADGRDVESTHDHDIILSEVFAAREKAFRCYR